MCYGMAGVIHGHDLRVCLIELRPWHWCPRGELVVHFVNTPGDTLRCGGRPRDDLCWPHREPLPTPIHSQDQSTTIPLCSNYAEKYLDGPPSEHGSPAIRRQRTTLYTWPIPGHSDRHPSNIGTHIGKPRALHARLSQTNQAQRPHKLRGKDGDKLENIHPDSAQFHKPHYYWHLGDPLSINRQFSQQERTKYGNTRPW